MTLRKKKADPARPSFYITTPIYYVNDVPHIGHAYTTVAADVLARYHRLLGHRTFFLTGTDEHGQKVQQAAAKAGVDPQAHADRMVVAFQELWKRLMITNDDFIRTTEERHTRVVREVLTRLKAKGVIYEAAYEGWYCLPDERFWTDAEVVDRQCPECGRPVDRISERNYFFRMSRFQKRLAMHIRRHPGFIAPPGRRNEVLGFLTRPLEDLCISRPRRRLSWGIPFPFDPDYVTYVWVDALVNYISAPGYGADDTRFQKWWPANLHLVGKDILTTHAVYWSTLLMALDLELPKILFAHGWWTLEGGKMSKSRGNVIDPNALVSEFGADAFRYFLLREIPFGQDGDFSRAAVLSRFNSELANDLGNLVSRTHAMIERYSGGRIPKPGSTTAIDRRMRSLVNGLDRQVRSHLEGVRFDRALRAIWKAVDFANQYIERNAPWALAKEPRDAKRLNTVLYHLAETLRILSLYLSPFIPISAARIASELGWREDFTDLGLARGRKWGGIKPGVKIRKGAALFPRMESQGPDSAAPVGKKKTRTEEIKMTTESPPTPLVDIEEFRKLNFRVGRIRSAEKIPGTDKLLKLSVDIGDKVVPIVAGIAPRYSPDQLQERDVIVVTNLKPVVIRGVESQGMILAAGDREVEALATFKEPVRTGAPVR